MKNHLLLICLLVLSCLDCSGQCCFETRSVCSIVDSSLINEADDFWPTLDSLHLKYVVSKRAKKLFMKKRYGPPIPPPLFSPEKLKKLFDIPLAERMKIPPFTRLDSMRVAFPELNKEDSLWSFRLLSSSELDFVTEILYNYQGDLFPDMYTYSPRMSRWLPPLVLEWYQKTPSGQYDKSCILFREYHSVILCSERYDTGSLWIMDASDEKMYIIAEMLMRSEKKRIEGIRATDRSGHK
jgi:hypothetical protein